MRAEIEQILEGKAGELDPKSSDPSDPTVIIRGFGTMLLSQLKADVVGKLEDLAKRAKRDDFQIAHYEITKSGGVLPHKLTAIADAEKQMSTSSWKRRITMYKKK
ncbi:MAG: hypothetical protein HOH07_00015 [Euryarchaeota archaeon]|nr:hypothetical protein [Euryarchaeota archaeon]